MRSHNAWKDLKAAANALNPKLQLAHAVELHDAIQQRLGENKPLGQKRVKKKDGDKKPDSKAPNLKPQDISIPPRIFREGTDIALTQLSPDAIGPQARGIVVVTATEAAPYLKVAQPVSANGLGLIVLDHAHALMRGVGELIRFPARCEQTEEPLLLTARLVQLGSVEVCRNTTTQAPRIDEVANAVVKLIVFRDELDTTDWDTFRSMPVRHLLEQLPALQKPDCILDCWDRQHLTLRMARTHPRDSEVYIVSLRLTGISFPDLLATSGQHGIYLEPRNIDGDGTASDFRVIWMGKQDRPTVQVAKQSTTKWVSLVRSGNRFGL